MTDDEWEILKPAAAALAEAQIKTKMAKVATVDSIDTRMAFLRAVAEEEVAQQHYDMARIQNRKRGMS